MVARAGVLACLKGTVPLIKKSWWTVFAVYDEDNEPYVHFVEAIDVERARTRALRDAEGVILISGIVHGRVYPADTPTNTVTPIRGKEHAITVSHVRVTQKKLVIPGRCSKCKGDFRRAGALIETWFGPREWHGHLSHNGKDLSAERDGMLIEGGLAMIDTVRLRCSGCGNDAWNGVDNG